MEQIYIIGDVHGCYKSLLALIEQLPNKKNSKIVFVGDLIDRGKNSCEVIELIINNNYDCVMGNHEELF
ncbi:metallophosphoesterase, partial [Aliarcobacter butzleri]